MLLSAWPMVAKRGLAHWRLLSSVVVGVLLASVILAGTVIYFDALRELALKNTLSKLTARETDIVLKADRGPTSFREFEKVSRAVTPEIETRLDWFLKDTVRGGKTATFFLTPPGRESTAGEDNARAYFAYLPRLLGHITLRPEGRMPREQALNAPGELLVIEAMIPSDAARLFGIEVGDRLSVVPFWTDAIPYASVIVAGIFDKNDPGEEFWHLDDTILRGSTAVNFRAVPFFLTESTYMDVLGGAFPDLDSTYAWLLEVDTGKLNAGNAADARADIEVMRRRLSNTLFSYRQITSLDEALAEYDQRLFFSKLPMFVVLILISVVILYYVVTLSSLVVEQQRGEIALLRSRGATSAQILAVFVLEGATISLLAIVVAPLLASLVVSVLGFTPAFSGLSGGERLPVGISGAAYLMSGLGGLLSFAALMIPSVQASRIGVTRHRQEAARPSSQPFFQRYYLDILLLVVSILLFRQLTERGSVVATDLFGGVAVDQALLAVPALILVASALVLLRLFPLVMAVSSRLLSPRLPAGLVLGIWQMARNPTHYARLSLLLILMTGLGIFAASFGGTLTRSFEERALYATGADIRLEGVLLGSRGPSRPVVGTYERLPGVDRVSPAFRGFGSDLSRLLGDSYIMLGVDTGSFGDVAWFRDDFSGQSLNGLMRSLEGSSVPEGTPLPDGAYAIGVTLKPDRPHPNVVATARIRDTNDRYFTYVLGRLGSEDWIDLESSLSRTSLIRRRQPLQPVAPLTLVALSFLEPNARSRLRAGSVAIDEVWVRTGANTVQVIDSFDDLSRWNIIRVAPESVTDGMQPSTITSDGAGGAVTFVWSGGGALIGRGLFYGPPVSALPVIASKSFLKDTRHSVGEEFMVSAAGHRILVRPVDSVDYFPTLDTLNEKYLIADLTSLSRYANLESASGELKPNEIWLTAEANGSDRQALIDRFEADDPFFTREVHDRAAALADSQVDPLVEAGWRALLFIAFAAVLILSGLGFFVHAYVSFRSRETQFALMRTIGFSLKQLITLVWLEQALVIAAGMALGTWMGGRLGATVMPYLGHDDRGSQVLPPFILEVSWGTLAATYGAMVFVFALIIVGMIWFIHKISLQRILRLGEM